MNTKQETPESVVTNFLTDADSVRSNSLLAVLMAQGLVATASAAYSEFLRTCEKASDTQVLVPNEKLAKFKKLQREQALAQRAVQITSRAWIVALVSQYDAFLSGLVRVLLEAQPKLLQSSKKSFEASELLAFGNIEEIKGAIIDEEVESLLRESHHEQFAWLERRFDIRTLRSELPSWPAFVELTQRRNLFVHTDGRVSKQYLKICSEQNVTLTALNVGEELDADASYVRAAADTLAEIAVKLTQVLWRKTLPAQISEADRVLTEITYNLIERKRYKLAIKLLDFGLETFKKFSATECRLRLVVNRANAYRLLGDTDRCRSIMRSEDWSACDNAFKLASQLLTGNQDQALATMRTIGTTGIPSKTDYRDWPLFEGFRDSPQFRDVFREIFREELAVPAVITAEGKIQGHQPSFIEMLDSENIAIQTQLTVNPPVQPPKLATSAKHPAQSTTNHKHSKRKTLDLKGTPTQ